MSQVILQIKCVFDLCHIEQIHIFSQGEFDPLQLCFVTCFGKLRWPGGFFCFHFNIHVFVFTITQTGTNYLTIPGWLLSPHIE